MTFLEWLTHVFTAVGDVWALRTPAALELPAHSALLVAGGVALFAGLATMFGHSVVFMINRVRRLRMVAGMALGAIHLAVMRLTIAAVIGGLTAAVLKGKVEATTLIIIYLLASAPRVFAFFVFIPHLGLLIGRLLEMWMLVCLTGLLINALGIETRLAIVVTGAAWVVGRWLSQLLATPLAVLSSRAWSVVTGRETFISAQDVLAGAPFLPLERPRVAK